MGLASPATYVFNDGRDAARDRLNPEKRLRPIATGRVAAPAAAVLSLGLAILAGVRGSFGP